MQSIQAFLSSIVVGPAVASADLAVFPLIGRALHEHAYDTLQDTIRAGHAKVTEVSESGHVPELRVVNDGGSSVLIVDGEELVGAKQNRVLNTTVLVAAGSQLTIPVSCVEQGRWQRRGERFAPGNASLYASLRARKAARVSESLGRAYSGHRDHSVRAIVITRSEVS
jgi:ARG and Rhodanese-Phosphatase-superfamily-associated Protein domain